MSENDWNDHKMYINNTLKHLNDVVENLNVKVAQLEIRVMTVCAVASILGSGLVTFAIRVIT